MNQALIYVTNGGNIKTPTEGVYNQCWAATADKKILENGAFYEPVAVLGKHTKESSDPKLVAELWDWMEKELGKFSA